MTTDHSIKHDGGRIGFLLVHGLGGTPLEMRYVARGLARAGHTVHCPQLAGHCGTYEDLRATSWYDWYDSVVKAHKVLAAECDVVIAGGLSAGAILALHLAADYPERVDGTALLAPTLKLDGWGVPWYSILFGLITQKWCADLVPFVERDPYGIKDPRVRALVMNAINSGDSAQAGQFQNPGSSMLEFRWMAKAIRPRLASIKQPTLIVHPRDDDRARLATNAGHLQRHLGGLVETFVLDDSYHVVTFDRQRELVVNRMNRFADWMCEARGIDVGRQGVAKNGAQRALKGGAASGRDRRSS